MDTATAGLCPDLGGAMQRWPDDCLGSHFVLWRCGARAGVAATLHPATSYGFSSTLVLVLWHVFCKSLWQQALLLSLDGCEDTGRLRQLSQACHQSTWLAVKQAQHCLVDRSVAK